MTSLLGGGVFRNVERTERSALAPFRLLRVVFLLISASPDLGSRCAASPRTVSGVFIGLPLLLLPRALRQQAAAHKEARQRGAQQRQQVEEGRPVVLPEHGTQRDGDDAEAPAEQ